jgi:hypothetical protein
MPANLTPEYKAAEAAFRKARDPGERLERLREMLRVIPKHKGTDHLQGDIKRRVKELAEELERPQKGGARGGPPLVIRPEGAAQIALIGPPNVGKSSLHARLTGSAAHAAPYPFTTQYPEPGMMPHENISFQLVDLPAVSAEHPVPWLASTLQTADAALLVVDLADPACLEQVETVRTVLRERRVTLTDRWVPAGESAGAIAEGGEDPFALGLPALLLANKVEGLADVDAELRAGPRHDRPLALQPSGCRPRLHQGAGPPAGPGAALRPPSRPDRGGRRAARPQGRRALAQVRARMGHDRIRRTAGRA